MAPAITEDGREVIINDIQYFEYIRNGEAITYSRFLAYEKAMTEYEQLAGHSQMMRFYIQASTDLSNVIFNFRDTDRQRDGRAEVQGLRAAAPGRAAACASILLACATWASAQT